MASLYIGLMSGTSLDGVDAVLVDFEQHSPRVLAHCSAAYSATLRSEFLALNTTGTDELHRAALAANALARVYADLVAQLLRRTGTERSEVRAIGAHGQTVRHRPGEFDGLGYTLQINQPALLAELCRIDVVADFRSRDLAAGGQGAPLVPPFHQALFAQHGRATAVLNIGGMANVTALASTTATPVLGFDCGPGNALLDGWCLQHTAKPFDDRGQWAASGTVVTELLACMLAEPFFAKPAPKSTGRDLFNSAWLTKQLHGWEHLAAADVQATLTELTAAACAHSIHKVMPDCECLIVCGGGALNDSLMQRLQAQLPHAEVLSSQLRGLPPLQVEASAFAWFARQTVLGKTASLPSVTGATGPRILGAIYPR